jgi:hypothetical protein
VRSRGTARPRSQTRARPHRSRIERSRCHGERRHGTARPRSQTRARPHRSRIERSRCHGERRQKFQSQWSSRIARLERAHNLDVMARMLLYGESRFLSGCDFKRLRAVRTSPETTSAFRARQQPSSRRRQVSATGLRKVAIPPRGRWFQIVLVTNSPAPLI